MRARWGRDDDRIHRFVGDRKQGVLGYLCVGESKPNVLEPGRVAVGDPRHPAGLPVVEVPDQMRPPVAGPEDGHLDHRVVRSPRRRRIRRAPTAE
jgi:hypothetical protein